MPAIRLYPTVRHATCARHGVTLLELLVVLVLITIASTVVVPTLVRAVDERTSQVEGGSAGAPTSADRLGIPSVRGGDRGLPPLRDGDALLAHTREVAIRRGEPLRVRVARDGVWAIVALRSGEEIDAGALRPRAAAAPAMAGWRRRSNEPGGASQRDGAAATPTFDIRVDAMGTCTPAGASATPAGRAPAFDPLQCRFVTPDRDAAANVAAAVSAR